MDQKTRQILEATAEVVRDVKAEHAKDIADIRTKMEGHIPEALSASVEARRLAVLRYAEVFLHRKSEAIKVAKAMPHTKGL